MEVIQVCPEKRRALSELHVVITQKTSLLLLLQAVSYFVRLFWRDVNCIFCLVWEGLQATQHASMIDVTVHRILSAYCNDTPDVTIGMNVAGLLILQP
jgi:hypothetical protein